MQVTVEVPADIAPGLAGVGEGELSQIIALGLREWQMRHSAEFAGLRGLYERLAQLPDPQEVLALRPAAELQQRMADLLTKSKAGGLSPAEEAEWQRLEFAEHLVRVAKAHAAARLKRA
jgi:hypothetical protein